MSDLSLLCITRTEHHAARFIDNMAAVARLLEAEFVLVLDGHGSSNGWPVARRVKSAGYVEDVLDQGVQCCSRTYVLRLDDDETCSPGMLDWLLGREYEAGQHWQFPRAHLWGDTEHMLWTRALWPDPQTRLSWRQFAGGRNHVHAGSPHGYGVPAPVALEHHKFVQTLQQRRALVHHYDRCEQGAGTRFRVFSVPEDYYQPAQLAAAVRPWNGSTLPPLVVPE